MMQHAGGDGLGSGVAPAARLGWRCQEASNGSEMIQTLGSAQTRPESVLCDS